eukprot:TRINITY_DN12865_c0_g1_i1.p1 TRINITY_DN12865_c0_g1~~TRINITY_DN12865_c0_g1_i1.p1  ORF type:complete len:186 (+),score=39.46 TRINITY_DN12865_c0_g1_i1:341-898(+)
MFNFLQRKVATIIVVGHPTLRQVAREVVDIQSSECQSLIKTMKTTLSKTSGVGLAAPQIGISQRIILIAPNRFQRKVLINPRYQPLSKNQAKEEERCLSIPGVTALVPRYTEICVEFVDEWGEEQKVILGGRKARIVQHEVDHLDGLVCLDRIESVEDIVVGKRAYLYKYLPRLQKLDEQDGFLN